MAQFTLRWILDFEAVTTVIPGSTTPDHVAENTAATDLYRRSTVGPRKTVGQVLSCLARFARVGLEDRTGAQEREHDHVHR
ncbi:hypothetical protein [Haloarcula marina]|uniref:hypothetical protein n=1 Tax=Haloarcula marina TaxID=2961574 RepID=UPI0020B8313E|nr:hypothetical protein [Halomicroarcula marina]